MVGQKNAFSEKKERCNSEEWGSATVKGWLKVIVPIKTCPFLTLKY